MISFIQKNLYTCFVIYIVNIIEFRLVKYARNIDTITGTAINGRRLASLRTRPEIFGRKEVMLLDSYEILMIVFTVIGLLIACSRK